MPTTKPPSPFNSPRKAREKSAKRIAEYAEHVNALTEKGERVIHVPVGIVNALATHLEGEGWGVKIVEKRADVGILILRDEDDFLPWEPQREKVHVMPTPGGIEKT